MIITHARSLAFSPDMIILQKDLFIQFFSTTLYAQRICVHITKEVGNILNILETLKKNWSFSLL